MFYSNKIRIQLWSAWNISILMRQRGCHVVMKLTWHCHVCNAISLETNFKMTSKLKKNGGAGKNFKGFQHLSTIMTFLGGVSYEEFKKIFANNKNVIEEFVLENSNIETLEKWVEEKSSKVNKQPKTSRGANQLKNWKVIWTKRILIFSTPQSFFPSLYLVSTRPNLIKARSYKKCWHSWRERTKLVLMRWRH